MHPHFFANESFEAIYDRDSNEQWCVQIAYRAVVSNYPPHRSIYLDGNIIAEYKIGDIESERIAIVYLLLNGVLSQINMAKAWGLHKNTLNNYYSAYLECGINGLKTTNYAPREARKNSQIKAKKNLYKEAKGRQLCLDDLFGDLNEEETMNEEPVKHLLDNGLEDLDKKTSNIQSTVNVQLDSDSNDFEAEELTIVECEYGGFILFAPFIEELFGSVFEKLKYFGAEGFQKLYETILTLIFCVLIGNACPEWLKSMKRKDLGALIGKKSVFCCKTYKQHLSRFSDKKIAELLKIELSKNFVKKGYVELGTIYVDGHFVPYYGKKEVFKGYSTQRRIALPGHYQNWVNDSNGKPILFRVNNSFVKFTSAILNAVKDVQELMASCGMYEPIIVVFDRGGYDSKLFTKLDEMKVGFITWKKGFKEIEFDKFNNTLSYVERNGETVEYKMYKTHYDIKNYRDNVDGIIICDDKNTKQASIISNLNHIGLVNKTDSFIVSKIDSRWVQENFFKEAKVREHIDHHFGYEFEKPGDTGEMGDHEVDNPVYLEKEFARISLKKKYESLQIKKGAILDKYNNMKRRKDFNIFLKQKSNKKVIDAFEIVSAELSKVTEEQKKITPKIPYAECKPDNSKSIFKTEKTTSLLAIISGVYNLRKRFESIAKECFKDHRELGKFILQLVNSRAKITISENIVYFTLDAIETPCYQRAAEKLVEKINLMGIYDFSKKDRRIIVNFKKD